MLSQIIQIILLVTILIQLILAVYMLYNTHQQYKNDEKFYERLYKDLDEQHKVFLEMSKGEENGNR